MPPKPIDSATAKEELSRINDALDSPRLLIGGLAVQQYIIERDSKDIDLICEHDVVRTLIKKLYPNDEWERDDKNRDEYRPSIRIRHRTKERGEIIFGPKILEREPYQHIDWEMLRRGARPFKHQDMEFKNILVPTPSALAFTKLLSFIGRNPADAEKRLQDLDDLAGLSNDDDFSLIQFVSFITEANATGHIKQDLRFQQAEFDIFKRSSLARIMDLLGAAVDLNPNRIAKDSGANEKHDMAPIDRTPIEDEIVWIALKHQPQANLVAKEMLVVVDVQRDFFEGGALAAHDTSSLIAPLNELIRRAEKAGILIVFTRDWHPKDHHSFAKWGKHCQKDTEGAQFHPDLYRPENSQVVDIGSQNDTDDYSPFLDHRLQYLMINGNIQTLYVVGIALEFCVLATCRDATWYGKTVIAVEPYIKWASKTTREREDVWQLLTSWGVVRAQNVAIGLGSR